jgi:hypothetical protein
MIPFVPVIQEGEAPFTTFVDLWHKYRDGVLDPFPYTSVSELREVFDKAVVARAKRTRAVLEVKKAEELTILRSGGVPVSPF